MRLPKPATWAVLGVYLFSLTGVAHAWNSTGHRVIASIAYRQLDEATRSRVAAVLKNHPAYKDLWLDHANNGTDPDLALFWNASIFPDEARRPPWTKFNRPMAHYVNFRILADEGNKVEPPANGENAINSYTAHLKQIRDPKTLDADRANHLAWIFHQSQDIHQPLHSVARFSATFPSGDKGGNGVTIPNPRAFGDKGNNLHAYWDNLLGVDESPENVNKVADSLIAEYPRAAFADELKLTNIRDWAEEAVGLSLKTVYNNLDANIAVFTDRPVGYDADAERVARKRAALAGYRLAEELKRLFAEP